MKSIKDLPFAIKLLTIFLLLFASFYLFFISPKLKALKIIQEDIKKIENELQKAKELERNINLPDEDEKRKWKVIQGRIDAIPAEIDLPKIMGELAKLARINHISDVSFSTTRNVPSSEPKESRVLMGEFLIKISFHCQYRDLAYFLKGLDTMALGVVVESLEVRKAFPLIYAELHVRPIMLEK
jgi:hypothetical protein